ncbi:MAG: hypothetical protein QXO12_00640 [Candidatus Pacearchaeota archaeon]
MKKAVSYVEVLIAFSIFLFGISILFFIFSPYFRPEYLTSLNIIEKNFDRNFAKEIFIIKAVVNQTGCIKFKTYKNFNFSNILLFNKNWENLNYDFNDNKIILNYNENEFFLLVSNETINYNTNPQCDNAYDVEIYYSPPISEKFILDISDYDYENLKNILIPGLKNDFNISIYDFDGKMVGSFGMPIPKTNIFAKQKIYKKLENNQIKFVKVIFYIW